MDKIDEKEDAETSEHIPRHNVEESENNFNGSDVEGHREILSTINDAEDDDANTSNGGSEHLNQNGNEAEYEITANTELENNIAHGSLKPVNVEFEIVEQFNAETKHAVTKINVQDELVTEDEVGKQTDADNDMLAPNAEESSVENRVESGKSDEIMADENPIGYVVGGKHNECEGKDEDIAQKTVDTEMVNDSRSEDAKPLQPELSSQEALLSQNRDCIQKTTDTEMTIENAGSEDAKSLQTELSSHDAPQSENPGHVQKSVDTEMDASPFQAEFSSHEAPQNHNGGHGQEALDTKMAMDDAGSGDAKPRQTEQTSQEASQSDELSSHEAPRSQSGGHGQEALDTEMAIDDAGSGDAKPLKTELTSQEAPQSYEFSSHEAPQGHNGGHGHEAVDTEMEIDNAGSGDAKPLQTELTSQEASQSHDEECFQKVVDTEMAIDGARSVDIKLLRTELSSHETIQNQNAASDETVLDENLFVKDGAGISNTEVFNDNLKEQGEKAIAVAACSITEVSGATVETGSKQGDASSVPVNEQETINPSSIAGYEPAKVEDHSVKTVKTLLNQSSLPLVDVDEDGTPEEQEAFIKLVESIYREKEVEFRPPKFYGQPLNCLKLWRSVIRLGGYDHVTGAKLWRQVGESFHPPKTCTTVSWTFRIFYEKSLLDYERHKRQTGELCLPEATPFEASSVDSEGNGQGSGRARRDAAARAMQGWHAQRISVDGEVCESIIKEKNHNTTPTKRSLKQKRSNEAEQPVKSARTEASRQLETSVVDIGPPADWVKINVRQNIDCFEVYALIPGLLRNEVRVQSDPAGRLVISGQPDQVDNPWGIAPFKKVVSLPSRIDALQTSAVVSVHGRLYVRLPFEQ